MSIRSVKAGSAYVELYTEDSKLARGLAMAQRRLKAFGVAAQAAGMKLVGLGATIIAPLTAGVMAASRMAETMNKFNVVFGKSAAAVKVWADQFAGQIGRSREQIASFMAGSQDLFVPLGFDSAKATELSKQITQLAIDLASFNNMADADTLRDLHAALTGSKQELLNQSIDPSVAADQEKVMARLNIIMRGTTAAQGDALRSADSFANRMKALRAKIDDVAVTIGEALIPILNPLLAKVGNVVKVIGQWIRRHGDRRRVGGDGYGGSGRCRGPGGTEDRLAGHHQASPGCSGHAGGGRGGDLR
ncbi:MAG: hypothetical protein JRJ72_13155 [Deltaproteobacteria bacterium]|nr:hypothetical protein [Deltaproteobacteria bacterium]